MKARLLTFVTSLLMATFSALAGDINSLTLTVQFNGGEPFEFSVPESGFDALALEDAATSIIVSKLVVTTAADVTDMEFCATIFSTSHGAADPNEFRYMPLENKGQGQWVLELGNNGELIDPDWLTENKNKTFEFYARGKKGGNAVYYNNGGANYQILFYTGEGEGGEESWSVKFYRDKTATLSLTRNKQDNLLYTFSGSAERTPTDQPGQLTSLVINAFSVQFIRNDDIRIADVSIQYRIYEDTEKPIPGDWNRIDATKIDEEIVYNPEKDRSECRVTCTASNINLDVASQLQAGKNYAMEVMYQVIDTNNQYHMLGKEREGTCLRFSKLSDNSVDAALMDKKQTAPSIFTISGQRMSQPRHGVNIIDSKKVLVK